MDTPKGRKDYKPAMLMHWQVGPMPEWNRRIVLRQLWRYRMHDHYSLKSPSSS